jgi:acetyl esterase/lipase
MAALGGGQHGDLQYCVHNSLTMKIRSEDKSEHAQLAVRIANSTACPVAVPNYRLTPSNPQHPGSDDPIYTRHPSHAQDVLDALTFLYRHTRGSKSSNDIDLGTTASPTPQQHARSTVPFPISLTVRSFHLVGHSCGAHILTSIFLLSASITPSLTPPDDLIAAVGSVTLSEGIYDLDALIESFPEYDDWFVRNAFGEEDRTGNDRLYARFATTTYPLHPNGSHIRWNILHSQGDSLVDMKQSELINQHLRKLHEEIEQGQSDSHVLLDVESLTQEHNEMLKTEAYSGVVGKHIRALLA